jgi:hypothetical protein
VEHIQTKDKNLNADKHRFRLINADQNHPHQPKRAQKKSKEILCRKKRFLEIVMQPPPAGVKYLQASMNILCSASVAALC